MPIYVIQLSCFRDEYKLEWMQYKSHVHCTSPDKVVTINMVGWS